MNIWIVWGYPDDQRPVIWSIHKTEEGAKKVLARLSEGFIIEYAVNE